MYAVSDEYKTAMKQPVQQYKLKGKIGNVDISDKNILAGSLSTTNQCSGSGTVDIGQVYIGELSGTFLNTGIPRKGWKGLVISLSIGMRLADGTFEYIPLAPYTVNTADWSASGVVVKAYDAMDKFDKSINASVDIGTPYELLTLACTTCGVELHNTQEEIEAMANGTRRLTLVAGSDIRTWRDFLSWITQTLGANATIGKDGKLLVFQYNNTAVDTIDPEHRISGGTFSDFTTRYTGISRVDQADQMTRYYSLSPDDGLTYNLGTNPFMQTSTQLIRKKMAEEILGALSVIDYVPFKCSLMAPPVYDLADCLRFTDGLADESLCCINKLDWKYNGLLSLEGFGKEPELASAHSKTDKNISGLISADTNTEYRIAFTNGADVSIENGEDKRLILCAYIMNEAKFTIIHGEAIVSAETVETEGDTQFTETDCTAEFYYKLDGKKITHIHPTECWQDGQHVPHFLYNIAKHENGSHSFEIWCRCNGGKISVPAGACRVIIDSIGLSANASYLTVVTPPNRVWYTNGQVFDKTGLKVIYYNGDDMSTTDVTGSCTIHLEDGTDITTTGYTYTETGTHSMYVKYNDKTAGFDTYSADGAELDKDVLKQESYSNDNKYVSRYSIRSIQQVDEPPKEYYMTYDMSADKNKSLIGYMVENKEYEYGGYDCYLYTPLEIIRFPEDCSHLFENLGFYTINFLRIDTSRTTNMSYMFANMAGTTEIELGNGIDTHNVTDMSYMFYYNTNLKAMPEALGDFDTVNVTNMAYMFAYDYQCTSVNVESFITTNVTDMSYMFSDMCRLDGELNCSGFDTSNVTNMCCMFNNVASFKKAGIHFPVEGFNTSKVTNMSCMFANSVYASVDVSGFDTSSVVNMSGMFNRCGVGMEKLTIKGISSLNTSKVTDMSSMFEYSYVTMDDLKNLDTSNVTNMAFMFYYCKFEEFNLPNLRTNKATKMNGMFSGCRFESLSLPSFTTDQVVDMGTMFAYCNNLKTLDLSSFVTSSVTNFKWMFSDCPNLQTIIADLDISSVQSGSGSDYGGFRAFYNCKSLPDYSEYSCDISYKDRYLTSPDGGEE